MPNWLRMPGGHLWVGHITLISIISLEQYLLDIRLQGDCHWHVIGREIRSCLNYLIYAPGNEFISPTVWHYWRWFSFFWKVGYMLVSLDICWIYISLDLTKAQQKHNILSQTLHIAGKFTGIPNIFMRPAAQRMRPSFKPWRETGHDSRHREDGWIQWGNATPGEATFVKRVGITRYFPE